MLEAILDQFPEPDWKIFRKLREVALDRYCREILNDAGQLLAAADGTSHERYRALWSLLESRDEVLERAFDNPRRSQALVQLTLIRRLGLITDEEFGRFSGETVERVNLILSL